MTWSRLDPGAGDPAAIRTMATTRSDEAEELRGRASAGLLDAVSAVEVWHGQSATAFRTRVSKVDGKIGRLASTYARHGAALLAYASAVEQIARDAAGLRSRIAQNDEELRVLALRLTALDGDPTAAVQVQQLESKVRAARSEDRSTEDVWDALSARRLAADQACMDGISGAASSTDSLSGLQYSPNRIYTDEQFMAVLGGMTAAQIVALLGSDPSFAARLAAVQDGGAVASWWQSLDSPVGEDGPGDPSPAQLALLLAAPSIFGNLNGIWYGHRDVANRAAFEAELAELEALRATYYSLVQTYSNSAEYNNTDAADFLAEHGFSESEFFAAWDELVAIENTLAQAPEGGEPPYQFIQYQPGDPTLAAVAVGNMDTASQITTDVPGMGTTVTKSLQEWTLAAQNVWRQQTDIDTLYDTAETGFAVVAWIGYDAPDMFPPSLQVLSSDNAQSGAPQLEDFLTGITETRDWDAGQNLSVIAHSYGTTTASLALAETPVENFIMLGSAGIDESIPHASDLMVDPDNIWASEAKGDWVADLGRGELTELGSTWDPLNAFEHQVDPTSSDYGANVFSSEADSFMGDEYVASDGHEASPQLDATLDGTWTTDTAYGYLDWGTNPLLLSSMLSLGLTDAVAAADDPSGGGGGR